MPPSPAALRLATVGGDERLDRNDRNGPPLSVTSVISGKTLPSVRVVRGYQGDPDHSPPTGYRYDGLFRVVDHWQDDGKDGYRVWRFRLVSMEDADAPPVDLPANGGEAPRVPTTIQRLVRSTRKALAVKQCHDYTCQVCGIRLTTPAGPYAEAAHIRALGRPHNGPDDFSNVLCLCPNHHVLFDTGAIYVDAAGVVREHGTNTAISELRTAHSHEVDLAHLSYHRGHHGLGEPPSGG
jgi:putative restriction endonuclease